jgi:hypothetical protein
VPATDQENGFLQRLSRVLFEQPDRYISAASRGLEGDLKEAVLPLEGSHVDISPTLRDLEPGRYWVRFEPIDRPGEAKAPAQVQWSPGNIATISAANLKSGPYHLFLVEQSGEPTGSDAWILLCDKEHYAVQSAVFQQTADMVAAWPPETDAAAARAVLRAALESLAAELRGPAKP